MAKVITLSRYFPDYHPKAGQPTYFVEQVLNSLGIEWDEELYFDLLLDLNKNLSRADIKLFFFLLGSDEEGETIDLNEKPHTIRANWTNKKTGETYQVWKAGDKASLRVWGGVPYNSPQIIIAPEVELVRVGNFEITLDQDELPWMDIGTKYSYPAPFDLERSIIPSLAKNDGLETQDLLDWFNYPKPFVGQILCWKEVDYV